MPSRRLFITVFLFALILIGILATFRLAGILQEPRNPPIETITCKMVKYEFERPNGNVELEKLLTSPYIDNEGNSATLSLSIDEYDEDSNEYGGADLISFNVSVLASIPNGFVDSIHIIFEENYKGSRVSFYETHYKYGYDLCHMMYVWRNLTLHSYKHWVKNAGVKGYIIFSGLNMPKTIFFRGPIHWILYGSQQNQTHNLTIKAEIIYYNGSDYVRLILPAQIIIWAEAGESFETAREMVIGEYIGFLWVAHDPEDYYRIWVENGQKIWLKVEPLKYPPVWQDFEVYLYNPSYKLVANATEKEVDYTPEELSYKANITGYWYIRIVKVRAGGGGLYKLTISLTGDKP
jgi:hypothetical protein